jgi:hypothetical protein
MNIIHLIEINKDSIVYIHNLWKKIKLGLVYLSEQKLCVWCEPFRKGSTEVPRRVGLRSQT